MKFHECILCGSSIEPVLSLGDQVYVNTYVKDLSDTTVTPQPLELCVCSSASCRHLQLSHLASPEVLFKHYFWVTGTAKTTQLYAQNLANDILAKHLNASTIVEIASNDGTFLRPFITKGLSVLGVEPADNIAQTANNNGVPTLCSFFDERSSDKCLHTLKGYPDIILARNVIPHTPAPVQMVEAIAKLAGTNTSIYIEIHCFESIYSDLQYDSIYHEHYSYFSLYTLTNLFNKFNLHPVSCTRTAISGGSLLVEFKTKKPDDRLAHQIKEQIAIAKSLHQQSQLNSFATRCKYHSSLLLEEFRRVNKLYPGVPIYSYGSSARGNTILTHAGVSSLIHSAVDGSPLKWNSYNANTGLKIISINDLPKDIPFIIYLAAWNFKDEILGLLADHGLSPLAVLVPFPGKPSLIIPPNQPFHDYSASV